MWKMIQLVEQGLAKREDKSIFVQFPDVVQYSCTAILNLYTTLTTKMKDIA